VNPHPVPLKCVSSLLTFYEQLYCTLGLFFNFFERTNEGYKTARKLLAKFTTLCHLGAIQIIRDTLRGLEVNQSVT